MGERGGMVTSDREFGPEVRALRTAAALKLLDEKQTPRGKLLKFLTGVGKLFSLHAGWDSEALTTLKMGAALPSRSALFNLKNIKNNHTKAEPQSFF